MEICNSLLNTIVKQIFSIFAYFYLHSSGEGKTYNLNHFEIRFGFLFFKEKYVFSFEKPNLLSFSMKPKFHFGIQKFNQLSNPSFKISLYRLLVFWKEQTKDLVRIIYSVPLSVFLKTISREHDTSRTVWFKYFKFNH